jgi:hypothetical protein
MKIIQDEMSNSEQMRALKYEEEQIILQQYSIAAGRSFQSMGSTKKTILTDHLTPQRSRMVACLSEIRFNTVLDSALPFLHSTLLGRHAQGIEFIAKALRKAASL